MFDIGFWEIALIGVIALLVVGPERLPGLARNVGLWVGRIRRYVSHVKQDIERELHADEVRELLERGKGLGDIREVAEETASVLKDARGELDEAARAAEPSGAPSGEPPPGAIPDAGSGTRSVTHQAGEEDAFAPSNLASVSPGDAPAADAARAADTEDDNERHADRQGQH